MILWMTSELTVLLYFGSQLPAPPPRTSTKNEAISRQYAIVSVERTSTKVDVTIQYRRLYFDVDASEMAPKSLKNQHTIITILRPYRLQLGYSPMTGWAIKPLIGPASHTRLVSCSESPRSNRKGVPYLQPHNHTYNQNPGHAMP